MEVEALALDNPDKAKQVIDSVSGLIVNADRVTRVREVFRSELELGLKYGLEKVCYSLNMPLCILILQSSVQMETTYVTELLQGDESGKFLALDLGSTNFR